MQGHEIIIALSFVLAVICLISVLFTQKKLLFAISAIVLFGIFYFTNSKYEMADNLTMMCFVMGITLLALEIFIPSFGVIGIVGIALTGFSIIGSLDNVGSEIFLMIATAVAILLSVTIFVKLGFTTNIFEKEILNTTNNKDRGFNSKKDYKDLLGKEGVSKSILRPSGRVEIEGITYDCMADGDFIRSGVRVKVSDLKDRYIIVKEI